MKRLDIVAMFVGMLVIGAFTSNASAMYHPTLGKWISRDPLGYIDGMNLQRGLASNPVNNVDPKGLAAAVTNFAFIKEMRADGALAKDNLALPEMGEFDFKDWAWLVYIGPFPDLKEVQHLQNIKIEFHVFEGKTDVAHSIVHKSDSGPLPVLEDKTVGVGDTRDALKSAKETVDIARTLKFNCDRFELRVENTIELREKVELQTPDEKWVNDDPKYHDDGTMTNISTYNFFNFPDFDKPEIGRGNSGIKGARGAGATYYGPVNWTIDVKGHITAEGKGIVDSGKIDFSGLKPAKILNAGLTSAVHEYKPPK